MIKALSMVKQTSYKKKRKGGGILKRRCYHKAKFIDCLSMVHGQHQ